MKYWKRMLSLLLAGIMTLSLCACGPGGGEADPSADPSDQISTDPDALATPEIEVDLTQGPLEFSAGISPDQVLLTVNGEEITADIMLYWLDYSSYYFMYQYGMYGMSLNDSREDVLNDAVNICASETVLRQRAAQLGCLPTDAQIQAVQDQLDQDPDSIRMFQEAYGLSDDAVRYLFLSDPYYSNMLDAVTHVPSDEELEEYLTAQQVYRVKHILLGTLDENRQPLPEDVVAAKKAQAEELLAELQSAADLPALFDQRMNELSEDGRDENGDLYAPDGYLTGPGAMVAEFEQASLALQPGQLSGIVETAYGYHIILRLPLLPLTDSERDQYAGSFRPDALRDQVDQWVAESDIVRADALTNLDISAFYDRMGAYQQALQDQISVG